MSDKMNELGRKVRESMGRLGAGVGPAASRLAQGLHGARLGIIAASLMAAGGYALYKHPPMQSVGRGETAMRINQITGESTEFKDGAVLVIPGLHELRRYSLRDRIYRPAGGTSASGAAPFQSVEGLSLGVDISVRYHLDPARIPAMARSLPEDIDGEVVEPVVQGVLYKTLAKYTVREIFSTKRQEIQQVMEAELKPRLAADGIVLEGVTMGKVDLPHDYKAGMEKLLAEELETEKMRYTLELKDKQVKQTALEAEAEKVARIKGAEAQAEARRIEAAGEADSRQKLADAEAYRQERLGKIASEQLARDGALIQKNPLLIQKTLADKLSDKISVIIAPPPADGGFIGSALVGGGKAQRTSLPQEPAAGQEGE